MKFIDEVFITVGSGKGGPGCISFRRETFEPRGGPDGGDGGRGGDVVFKVNRHLNSLIDLKNRRKLLAGNGLPGGSSQSSGQQGEDLVIDVPKGTVIKDSETKEIIADLEGQEEFLFLKGGRGGKGNAFFKNSVNQAPEKAQPGEGGEQRKIHLELKMIADVGLLGFPNVGKSTLISHISAAKPKIADYPFTTLVPNLGVVKVDAMKSFVVADIPGIIEGAHEGVGLGIQFLRHIQRTKVFVHVVDICELSGRDPYEDFVKINSELSSYDEISDDQGEFGKLSERPQLVVLNKIDTMADEDVKAMEDLFKEQGVKTISISAVTGKNIKELLRQISNIVFAPAEDEQ